MLCAYVNTFNAENPVAALCVGQQPKPVPSPGQVLVKVTCASLNHHDLWSLRGVGLRSELLPMILGCDAVGVVETVGHKYFGRKVLVYPVISDRVRSTESDLDETLDPQRTLLSEQWQGTLAEFVKVPEENLIPLPEGLDDVSAACLPTAYLTAYRMLFTQAKVHAGSVVLVQGAGGGVSLATAQLALAAGCTVYVTGRELAKRNLIGGVQVGGRSVEVFEPGARLPQRVDVVIETVGEATWSHSLKSLKPGGCIVVCGATSGAMPAADLQRVFFLQLRVLGSTMGTLTELTALLDYLREHRLRPVIDSCFPMAQAEEAFGRLASGEAFGKVVLTIR